MTHRRLFFALVSGAASLVLFAAAVVPNKFKGTIEGERLSQPPSPLKDIEVQVESGGNEKASTQSDQSGAFGFDLDASSPVFQLIIWDRGNRWWGREIAHIPNDAAHTNLPKVILRPQTSRLSPDETREQRGIMAWLRKHNPLSAGLMELHLGTFDHPGQSNTTTIEGYGCCAVGTQYAAVDYEKEHPGVGLKYQSAGSGSGLLQVISGTVDFAIAERRFMSAGRAGTPPPVDQIPIGLAATSVIYNSRGLPPNLQFSGPVLAKLFLGQIKSWDAAELREINPSEKLPSTPITVVRRSDASGSTDTLSQYLAAESSEWKDRVGVGRSLAWPAGVPAALDTGVAGRVAETEGAIGYAAWGTVLAPAVRPGLLRNFAGKYVGATARSIAAGYRETAGLGDLPETAVYSKDPEAYPMAAAAWMLLSLRGSDPRKELLLLDFAHATLAAQGPNQRQAALVPLPPQLVRAADEELSRAAARILDKAVPAPK